MVSFGLRFQQLLGHITGDLKRFSDGAPLSYQPWDILTGGRINAFRQLLE